MSPIFIHYEYEHDIPQLTLYFITTKMTSAFSQVKLGSLDQETSALFICDLQEKFSSVISHFPQVIENTKKLLEGCKLLKIPIIVTEQYPKGLGKTVSDLDVKECHVVAKTLFNMLVPEVLNLTQSICDKNLKSVVLLGVERLKQIGCYITSSETVLFKLLKSKDHPKFKEVAALVKTTSQPTELVSTL
ncbi:Isochorismatase domain-containing protein 2 [Armadillidium nasatum]|uniref:Isochorismatase domain-containing protein 2 n=1 Tax=Armadillidium nasatum TaxID=96803 RepID=A0A5N5T1Y5_9CRUS|nr:Isochorismatase domain-containing protein 2 [Armadillidium nasatum]